MSLPLFIRTLVLRPLGDDGAGGEAFSREQTRRVDQAHIPPPLPPSPLPYPDWTPASGMQCVLKMSFKAAQVVG